MNYDIIIIIYNTITKFNFCLLTTRKITKVISDTNSFFYDTLM